MNSGEGFEGTERRSQTERNMAHREIMGELKDLRNRFQSVESTGNKALDLLEAQDYRLGEVERTLWGHTDSRRRESDPGIVQVVNEIASAYKEVRAVAKAGWALLGLVGFSTVLSLLSLFLRIS